MPALDLAANDRPLAIRCGGAVVAKSLRLGQRLPLGAADRQQHGREQKMAGQTGQGAARLFVADAGRSRQCRFGSAAASGYRTPVRRALFIALCLLCLPTGALAAQAEGDVEVEARIGWGRTLRQGRFNPATARLLHRGRDVRPVRLEWYVPQLGRRAALIEQDVLLNPGTHRYAAALPIGPAVEAIHLTVVDPATNQTLAYWQSAQKDRLDLANRLILGEGPDLPALVAVAGRGDLPALPTTDALIEAVEIDALPRDAAGYDALDALVLDRPALATLDPLVQAAIADWTRGGGHLWVRLDRLALPPPDVSPLAALLLATLPGPPESFETDEEGTPYLRLAGQSDRPVATVVPAGAGQVIFLHGPVAALVPDALATLPLRRARTDTGGVDLALPAEAPSRRWLLIALPILCLVGPIDWLVLRLAGRRERRLPTWISLAATAAAIACVGVLAATSATTDAELARTTGPIADVRVEPSTSSS